MIGRKSGVENEIYQVVLNNQYFVFLIRGVKSGENVTSREANVYFSLSSTLNTVKSCSGFPT